MTGGVETLKGLALSLVGLLLNIEKSKDKQGYKEFVKNMCSHSDLELEEFQNMPEAEWGLKAESLRIGLTAIGRLLGRVDIEQVLDHLFKEFYFSLLLNINIRHKRRGFVKCM